MNNQDQIDYWRGETGITWAQTQDAIDQMLAPITVAIGWAASVRLLGRRER